MNLLKIIIIAFAVYFIRRMFQLYKFIRIQNQEIEKLKDQIHKKTDRDPQNKQSINAEYKIID